MISVSMAQIQPILNWLRLDILLESQALLLLMIVISIVLNYFGIVTYFGLFNFADFHCRLAHLIDE